jgi:hypothetical protein
MTAFSILPCAETVQGGSSHFQGASSSGRFQDGSTPKLNGSPPTPRRSGKMGSFWPRFCGIITQKEPKNDQKGAKIGQYQLLVS